MNTISKTGFTTRDHSAEKSNVQSTSTFWEDAEFNRYGITPMILLIVVCTGGIAAGMATADRNVAEVFAIAISTTLSLTTIISVAPMKVITAFCTAALCIDLGIILSNL